MSGGDPKFANLLTGIPVSFPHERGDPTPGAIVRYFSGPSRMSGVIPVQMTERMLKVCPSRMSG